MTEQEILFAHLDQLANRQLMGMMDDLSPDAWLAYKEEIDGLKTQYQAALDVQKDAGASKEQKEYAKNLCASIAKGVPDMTKAAISAAAAFRKGDPITGSAEVMNICAAVAPILGSLLSAGALLGAAGGPVGMLAGALFSVIGQILMLFGPKTESMYDKIENLLNRLEEDKELQHIKSAHDDVLNYARSLRAAAAELAPTPLASPILNATDANTLLIAIGTFNKIIADFKPIDGNTMTHFWDVMEWLKRTDRQGLDKWPEVLGVWCKSYTDLVTSTLTIALVGHSSAVLKRAEEVVAANDKVALTEVEKESVRKALRDLQEYANARRIEFAACNTTALTFLRAIAPVAQDRGLFFILTGGEVFAGTGKAVIGQDQWNHFFGYTRRMTVTTSKEDIVAGSLNPQYHFWNLGSQHYRPVPAGTIDDMYHARLDCRKLADPSGAAALGATVLHGSASEFSDICALPSPESKTGSYVYFADGEGRPPGVQLYKTDENNKFERVNWAPATKSPLLKLRAITPPPLTLTDDPDKDAMPPLLVGGVDHNNSILYGALQSSADIYVDQSNVRCYVRSPWEAYSGIAVDPYFLWVFGTSGFACATHASVLKSIQSNGATPPRWLNGPSLDSLLYDGNQYPGNRDEREGSIPPHPGLADLSPCEDGTLFISLTTRKVIKDTVAYDRNYFTKEDKSALYTAAYHIDFKAQAIVVKPWTRFAGGAGAVQVQKLPIPCWKVFDSLNADLTAKAKSAAV